MEKQKKFRFNREKHLRATLTFLKNISYIQKEKALVSCAKMLNENSKILHLEIGPTKGVIVVFNKEYKE